MEILNMWEYYIEKDEHHSDLRALELLIEERPDLAQRFKFVPQSLMNSYPHIEVRYTTLTFTHNTSCTNTPPPPSWKDSARSYPVSMETRHRARAPR